MLEAGGPLSISVQLWIITCELDMNCKIGFLQVPRETSEIDSFVGACLPCASLDTAVKSEVTQCACHCIALAY